MTKEDIATIVAKTVKIRKGVAEESMTHPQAVAAANDLAHLIDTSFRERDGR